MSTYVTGAGGVSLTDPLGSARDGGVTVMRWCAVHTVVSDATTATAAAQTDWIAANVLEST